MMSERQIPPRTEVMLVFAACVFPVFSWSIVWYFERMPDLLPFLPLWDLLSILAYTQAFALLESVFLLLFVVMLAAVLPAPWFRSSFAAQGSMIVFAITFWIMLFQLIFEPVIRHWTPGEFLLWFGLALVSILLACLLVRRSRRLSKVVLAIADRLMVFVYIYVPLGMLGLVVVLVRNIL